MRIEWVRDRDGTETGREWDGRETRIGKRREGERTEWHWSRD